MSNNNKDTKNNISEDRIKVKVSSLKENTNKENENNINNKEKNDNNSDLSKKINFFEKIYYSTIRLDKIQNLIESSSTWISYIIILLFILSIIFGFFIASGISKKIENFKFKINKLPDFSYKEGKIKGDIDTSFIEDDINRLIIINTIDSVTDIRLKYKKEIDKVEQYILFTKDIIYVEPGDSFEYIKFNFLEDQTFNKQDIIEYFDFLLSLKGINIISGIISAILILFFIFVLSFFIGRFLITLFTIYSIKVFDFKRINKLTVYLMTMPYLIYVIIEILNILNIFKLSIDTLLLFYIIYLIYIILTIIIQTKKYSSITVIKDIDDLKEVLDIQTKNTIEELENMDKQKKDERKKLKEKSKKERQKKQEQSKEKDEIVEGA